MADSKSIPTGLCQCGCGRATTVATQNRPRSGVKKGEFNWFTHGHTPLTNLNRRGYRKIYRPGKPRVSVHIHIAEIALGRPLPRGAEVHHVDGDKSNNRNTNLVICQDRLYHKLLHTRARVRAAGGDPNTQAYCSGCKQTKPFASFHRRPSHNFSNGCDGRCIACRAAYDRERRRREGRLGEVADVSQYERTR